MSYKHTTTVIFLLLTIVSEISAAQVAPEDPLRKPQIWIKLQDMPEDSVLWTMYVGKPWISMTHSEKEQIIEWKASLVTVADASNDDMQMLDDNIVLENDKDFWNIPTNETATYNSQRQVEEQTQEAKYFAQLENVMLQEPSHLSDLKDNIQANFPILEDAYFVEFSKMGVDYKYYSSAHPNGRYSRNLWIEEKTQELRAMKRKEFDRVKAQLTSSTR